MRAIFFIFVIFSISLNVYAQSNNFLDVVNGMGPSSIDSDKEYSLVVTSHSGCGYCQVALKELKQFEEDINIIVVDFSSVGRRNKQKSDYGYTFLNGNEIDGLRNQDIYPKLFLYDRNKKVIWKKRGWFKNNIKKINSKIEKL